MHSPLPSADSAVALFDARPFFEKALVFGIQQRIIDQTKLDAICVEAPKGIVQIAHYFGSEYLRPELERAKDRMVNLVSLNLEHSCNGDLHKAAEMIRDNSLLSRSKAGSDMLKALIAMPQNSHFGMNERSGFRDEHIPLLAKWSLRNLADYRAEWTKRARVDRVINAALWFAQQLELDEDELQEAGKDAEAVIRTGLLTLALKRKELPDWPGFEKLLAALRKKLDIQAAEAVIAIPKGLPQELLETVSVLRRSVLDDLPKIFKSKVSPRKLFDQTPAFMGRYFWLEDAMAEVEDYEHKVSAAWQKATGGASDDSTLLTLFVCLAAGTAGKTALTEKTAAALVRKIRKSGMKPELAQHYIETNAPEHYRADYIALWNDFVDEAQSTLASDMDYALKDALSLLRRECNVAA